MRLVDYFSAGIDNEDDMIATVRDHQIVDDAAIRVRKKRITLPSSRKPKRIDRDKAFECRCEIR